MPSRFRASTAGAITRPSSSPIEPCSPAWGLRAATASRGRAMPTKAFNPVAPNGPPLRILPVSRPTPARAGAGEHHGDGDPAGQLGEILGVAGMAETRVLQGLLLDRIGHHAGDLA